MTRDDASKEAMARIRMTIDLADEENRKSENFQSNADIEPALNDQHWAFGAPQKLVSSMTAIRNCFWIDEDMRKNFDTKLRSFVRKHFPQEQFDNHYRLTVSCLWLTLSYADAIATASTISMHLHSLHIHGGLDRQT